MDIKLKPIGFCRNGERQRFGNWASVATELVINPEYADALFGLGDYSHLVAVYFMHEVTTCDIRHVPQGKKGEVPEVGIFACRCAQRPNPIGITTAEIVGIKDNVVTVRGLDVVNGTPLLDLKPHTPQYDAPAHPRVPEWVDKLEY